MNDLRVTIFRHLQRLSLDFFTEEKAGVVMSRMTSDIENLQQLLQDGLAQFAIQGLTMVVITVFLFTTNVRLAVITIVVVIPPLIVMSIWFKRASERGYDKVRDGIALVLADLSESLQGVRVVTAHNRQRHNVVHHRNVVGSLPRRQLLHRPHQRHLRPGLTAARRRRPGRHPGRRRQHVPPPPALRSARWSPSSSTSTGSSSRSSCWSSSTTPTSRVRPRSSSCAPCWTASPPCPRAPTPSSSRPSRGEIRFDHVSFGYDPAIPVLEDIDLTIEPGETVAFVGATGAGKSTMAKLVTRFYDPTAGRVLIDGYDLRSVTLKSLRSQLGVVPQEPFLFAGTIRDNISFARPGAPDDAVWEAVHQVGLTELSHASPTASTPSCTNAGQSLSSGERQLIALARAFMAQPRVLVLDEATSNLDLQSETMIEAALDVLLQRRTAVLIAHRLSTAMRADRIVVVGDGRLLELGSHDELVARGRALRRDVRHLDLPVPRRRVGRHHRSGPPRSFPISCAYSENREGPDEL